MNAVCVLSVCDLYITYCNVGDPGNKVYPAVELISVRLNNEQLKWVLRP